MHDLGCWFILVRTIALSYGAGPVTINARIDAAILQQAWARNSKYSKAARNSRINSACHFSVEMPYPFFLDPGIDFRVHPILREWNELSSHCDRVS